MIMFIVFTIGFTAAFFSSMSGCGSGIITLPSWLYLGFPLPVAIACDKVNACFWTVLAARNYLREHRIQWNLLIPTTLIGLLGAYTATLTVISIDEDVLKPIIGGIILFLVGIMALGKEAGLKQRKPRYPAAAITLVGLPLGYYEAFFGAGNGIFACLALTKLKGFTIITSLGYYYAMAFIWCFFAASLLLGKGFYDIPMIISASIGAACGGHIGSHIGSRKGAGFVKIIFIILGGILGITLLFGI